MGGRKREWKEGRREGGWLEDGEGTGGAMEGIKKNDGRSLAGRRNGLSKAQDCGVDG